jgi:hypothetical protein
VNENEKFLVRAGERERGRERGCERREFGREGEKRDSERASECVCLVLVFA